MSAYVTLSSLDMGENADVSDYMDWVWYVITHMPAQVAFDVRVGYRPFGLAVETETEGDGVRDALLALWDAWCRARFEKGGKA